ncbi:MAG: arylesterase [Betaproteobacteria bacterium]|nr:arylesterase [Betaproteobacteria bacterium]
MSFIRLVFASLLFIAGAPALAAGTLLVFGDSLSAAYGISREAGWVTQLEQRLERERPGWRVVNASISGETSAGGAARLPAALAQYRPNVVILALGANDGLRGLPARELRANLARMIEAAQKRGARVLLAGMKVPPNYGPTYAREFEDTFAVVARRYRTAFLPFLLNGVADNRDLFLDDQLHPNAAAQPIILGNVWPPLTPLLN